MRPATRCCKSYEGVLPGFTVRQLLPEHQKPWLSWLAARGVDTSAGSSRHPPARRRGAGKTVTNAPPVYSSDETPTAFLAGEFIRWLGEQDGQPWFAHVSFISPHPPFIVPEPYNTHVRSGRRSGLPPRRKLAGGSRQPSLSGLRSRPAEAEKFLPGTEGQGARLERRRLPHHPRDLLRHDLGGRRAARPHLAGDARQRTPGTTRSSC